MTELLRDIVMAVPWWVRLIFSLGCIAGGFLACWFVDFRLGILLLIAGGVFLAFSEKSRSEKGGYNF